MMQIVIQTSGQVRCVYDEVIDLSSIGRLTIQRGSHVEPTPDGEWIADLHPVDGPKLGPFRTRSEALAAEVAWLQTSWLTSVLD